jgi:hypothetical protein
MLQGVVYCDYFKTMGGGSYQFGVTFLPYFATLT